MIPFDHLSFSSDAVLCNVTLDAVLRDSEELKGSPGAVVAVAGHVARRSYQLSRSLRVIGNLCLRRRHARDIISASVLQGRGAFQVCRSQPVCGCSRYQAVIFMGRDAGRCAICNLFFGRRQPSQAISLYA